MIARSCVAVRTFGPRAGCFRRFSQRASRSTSRESSAAWAGSRFLAASALICGMTFLLSHRGHPAALVTQGDRRPSLPTFTATGGIQGKYRACATAILPFAYFLRVFFGLGGTGGVLRA